MALPMQHRAKTRKITAFPPGRRFFHAGNLLLIDVFRPGAVKGNRRFIRADMPADKILHVVYAVRIFRVFRPHAGIAVRGYVFRHFAVSVAGDGSDFCPSEHVQYQIEEMHSPVDQNAAARLLFIRKISAQSGDAAVAPE